MNSETSHCKEAEAGKPMSKKCYRRMFYQNKNYKQHKDHETKTENEFSDIYSEESSVGHKESSGEEPLLSVSRQHIIVSESDRETLSSQDTEQPSRYLMSRTEEGLEQKHGDRKILQSPTSEGSDKDKAANNKTVSDTIIIKKNSEKQVQTGASNSFTLQNFYPC